MTVNAVTTGQAVTAELRRHFRIGPRTRMNRDVTETGATLRARMIEAITNASCYPGFYSEKTTESWRPAYGGVSSWVKHVDGYRLSGVTVAALKGLSPWEFSALIGEMADAGVTNVGEGERFLNAWKS